MDDHPKRIEGGIELTPEQAKALTGDLELSGEKVEEVNAGCYYGTTCTVMPITTSTGTYYVNQSKYVCPTSHLYITCPAPCPSPDRAPWQ